MHEDMQISIHAPSRERRPGAPHSITPLPFQSTLPRGSDAIYGKRGAEFIISIHAPSRERTDENNPLRRLIISIHAPSRERRI